MKTLKSKKTNTKFRVSSDIDKSGFIGTDEFGFVDVEDEVVPLLIQAGFELASKDEREKTAKEIEAEKKRADAKAIVESKAKADREARLKAESEKKAKIEDKKEASRTAKEEAIAKAMADDKVAIAASNQPSLTPESTQ